MDKEIEELKEIFLEQEAQRFKKIFKYVQGPYTLKKLLSIQTKAQLDNIRRAFNISGASTLKKAELIDFLSDAILYDVEEVINNFDSERFELISKLIKNNGICKLNDLPFLNWEYYLDLGIVFPCLTDHEAVMIMPSEIFDIIKPLINLNTKRQLKKNQEITNIIKGMVNFYGCISKIDAWKICEQLTNQRIPYEYITDLSNYYYEIVSYSIYICNVEVVDIPHILKEHRIRHNLEYCKFTKEQFILASQDDYIFQNKEVIDFSKILMKNFDFTQDELTDYLCEIHSRINNDFNPNAIAQFAIENLEIPSEDVLKNILDHLFKVMNSVPHWALKGHTPNSVTKPEISKPFIANSNSKRAPVISISTKKEVGRNDPCTCGSGKKFKKCCGNT
jgi:hypothetical protein